MIVFSNSFSVLILPKRHETTPLTELGGEMVAQW